MRKEYDFSKAKRAREVPHLTALRKTAKNKTRISIMLDDDVIAGFRKRAEAAGVGYQTEINRALREALAAPTKKPLTLDAVRRVVREELNSKRA
jgi:uncharacterized protein (DUF4415 family)